MNFKLPNYNFNDEHLKMLEDIQLSQKKILAKFTELNNRIKIEETFLDKLNLNIFVSIATALIICAILVIFGWHFWDIPSQTQAVNDYIYNQIIKESTP